MRSLIVALAVLPAAHSRPLTTAPGYVLDVHVTITDTRIVLDRHRGPRGVEARFVIENAGTRRHNFTLRSRNVPVAAGQSFSRTLAPHQREVVRLFLVFRARVPYFGGLPADRSKPGMNGFFVVD